ncbi:MAG: RNA polymerase sigma factor [Acidimicrobiia bacterium]
MKSLKFFNSFSNASLPVLIEAAKYGDEVAYEELISRTYRSVKLYCSSMASPIEANDLAQEVYLRALKSKTPILHTNNIEAFMISIAKCVCADYLSAKKKSIKLTAKLSNERSNDSYEFYENGIDLSHLNDEQREVLLLISILGFSYQEASDILNIPIGTIRSRFSRAKETAKQNLEATNTSF